jgi:hypothetical protein
MLEMTQPTRAAQSYSTNQYSWEAYICPRPWARRAATHLHFRDIDSSARVVGQSKNTRDSLVFFVLLSTQLIGLGLVCQKRARYQLR